MRFVAKLKVHRLKRLFTKAQKHYDDEKYLKAVHRYKRALKLIENTDLMSRAVIYERIGDIYSELELYEDARDSYVNAIKIQPNSEEIHLLIGIVYARLSENKLARQHFRQAFWLMSNDAIQLMRGAKLLKQNGFNDLSELWVERMLKLCQNTSFLDTEE